MTQELYINGDRVDMYGGDTVTLEYQSNLLNDITKIVGSFSYTIKLPKTIRNARILDNPGQPSYDSSTRRRYLPALYLRNGIDITGGCTAVLMDVSQDYEIALTWGPLRGFEQWAKNGLKLTELPYIISKNWKSMASLATAYTQRIQALIYGQYDAGIGSGSADVALPHPSTNAWWLFNDLLTSQAKVSYTMPDDVAADMKDAALLLVSRNSSKFNDEKQVGFIAEGATFVYVQGSTPDDDDLVLEPTNYTDKGQIFSQTVRNTFSKYGENESFYFELNIRAGKSIISSKGCRIEVQAWKGKDVYPPETIRAYDMKLDESAEEWYINIQDVIDLSGYEFFKLVPVGVAKLGGWPTTGERSIVVIPKLETLPTNAEFPLVPNLPDIKQIDYIKALCWMFGLFAVPTKEPSKIAFIRIDDIEENRTRALDWSGKLIPEEDGEPGTTTASLGDYAKLNYLKYKEDSENLGYDASGVIEVEGETLPDTKDLITLPFAATRGRRIRQYKDDGKGLELQKIEPRILKIESDSNNRCRLNFGTDQTFSELAKKYYAGYQRMVRTQIAIKQKFRLNEMDLRNLDFTVPIYLAQYGRYYAVKSVKTSSDTEICEVELLQMN